MIWESCHPANIKSKGIRFNGGFSGTGSCKWSSPTVKRILTDEVYLGHMVQGKTQKVNYKVKKCMEKPKQEWIRVENTHEPVVSEDDFSIVQHLLQTDGRRSPGDGSVSPFMGLLYCGDCGEQMIRRVNHYKGRSKVYYICSTKNRGEGCSRHSIEEGVLRGIVENSIRRFANSFLTEMELFEQAASYEANFESLIQYDKETVRLKQEQDKYFALCSALYEDLERKIISKEEFERLHHGFMQKEKALEAAREKQENLVKDMFRKGVLSAGRLKTFQDCVELKEIDRHTMSSMVRRIDVYENREVEIAFHFRDEFTAMADINGRMRGREGDAS